MTASAPPATAHDGWAGEREHDHGEQSCRCNTNCEWRDSEERQNKRWIKGGGARWRSWASSPLALLLFLPFKELHKLEEIMSALKQAEQIKQWGVWGGGGVCVWVVGGGGGGGGRGKRCASGWGSGTLWQIRGDNKQSERGSERL